MTFENWETWFLFAADSHYFHCDYHHNEFEMLRLQFQNLFFYPKILPDIFDVLWLSRTSLWYPSQETRKVDMQKKTRRFRKSWYDFSSDDEFLVFLLLRIVISRKLVTLFVSYLHYYFCTTKLPFYLLRASLISSYYDI